MHDSISQLDFFLEQDLKENAEIINNLTIIAVVQSPKTSHLCYKLTGYCRLVLIKHQVQNALKSAQMKMCERETIL